MTDEESKLDIFNQITEKYRVLEPVLSACKLTQTYRVPEFRSEMRLKQLQSVLKALTEFAGSEAIDIFKAAETLGAPGQLARWSQDELLAQARETRIYIKAVNLVRKTWRESSTLIRFFKTKEVKNASR